MIPRVAAMPVEARPLGDGDELIVSAGPAFELVTVRVVFTAGATLDDGHPGATLAGWELLDRGTHRRGRPGFHAAIEHLGARFGLATYRSSAVVEINVLSQFLEPALDLVAEALLEPADDQDELASLLDEIDDGATADLEDPAGVAARLIERVLWARGPWGVPVDGTRRSRKQIDVRLARDRRRAVLAHPAFVGLAADDPDAHIPTVTRFWERVRATSPITALGNWVRPPVRWGSALAVDFPASEQGALLVVADAPRPDSDAWPAAVLHAAAFGGGFASPLVSQLRSRDGLAYDVRWSLTPSRWGGLHHFRIHPAGDRLAYALAAAERCWNEAAHARLGDAELDGFKAYVLGGHLAALETVSQRLSVAIRARLMGHSVSRLWELPARIAEVEANALAAATAGHGWSTGRRSLAAAHPGGADAPQWSEHAPDWRVGPRALSSLR